MLASGQVGRQLNSHRYASGAHWTDIVSERVGHEGVLPCQMLNPELVLLGDHVGVLAPRDGHLYPVSWNGTLRIDLDSRYDWLLRVERALICLKIYGQTGIVYALLCVGTPHDLILINKFGTTVLKIGLIG